MELLHSSKIRDVYLDRGDVILVASDRLSVFDVVLPTQIPDKGAILTRLSLWWFDRTADLVDNHVISATDVPADVAGRAIRCRKLNMLGVECVARGYLTGTAWADYRETGTITGLALPPGLTDGDRLAEPVFTPSTKAPPGEGHDEPLTFEQVVDAEGAETAARLRDLTLAVYRRGAELAEPRGILLADTKLEFGWSPDGELVLADELLTPDSSRFWPADGWRPGGPQPSLDKQYVRDWAAATGWDKTAPGPDLPDEVVEGVRNRYLDIYERLTGEPWTG